MKLTKSIKIYFGIIIILATFSAINVFLPQGNFIGQYSLPASKPIIAIATFFIMLIIYGVLGVIGLALSKKLGFANLLDKKVSNKQRFLMPAFIGVALGIFFIIIDVILSRFHALGALPHPPFPTSVVASLTAAIGEEIIFRLFFISLWVWLISHLILKKKFQNLIFWLATIFSAFIFAFGHLPSIMMIYKLTSFNQIPLILLFEIFLLNGILSLFAAKYFREYGFLAAIGIHFWADIVWHVIYGLI